MACSEDKEIRECIRVHKITDEIKHVISLISLPFGRAITIVEKPSIARKPVVYDALGVLDTQVLNSEWLTAANTKCVDGW